MRTARTAGPVGRRDEISRIDGLLAEAAAGTSGVVALAVVAGVGKSQLARHCLARAAAQGFVELHGAACAYQEDLSFAPVVEALRPLVRGGDRELLDGLTDLGRLLDGLPLPPPIALGDPGLERARLFETIAELVQRVADIATASSSTQPTAECAGDRGCRRAGAADSFLMTGGRPPACAGSPR